MRSQRVSSMNTPVRAVGGTTNKSVKTNSLQHTTRTPQRSFAASPSRENASATRSVASSHLSIDSVADVIENKPVTQLRKNTSTSSSSLILFSSSAQRSKSSIRESNTNSSVKSKSLSRERSAGERIRSVKISSLPTRQELHSLHQPEHENKRTHEVINLSGVITTTSTSKTVTPSSSPSRKVNIVSQKRKTPSLMPAAGGGNINSTHLHTKRPVLLHTQKTSSSVDYLHPHVNVSNKVHLSKEGENAENVSSSTKELHANTNEAEKLVREDSGNNIAEAAPLYVTTTSTNVNKGDMSSLEVNKEVSLQKVQHEQGEKEELLLEEFRERRENSGMNENNINSSAASRLTHNMAVRSGGHPGALQLHHHTHESKNIGSDQKSNLQNQSSESEGLHDGNRSTMTIKMNKSEYDQHIRDNVHQSIAYVLQNTPMHIVSTPSTSQLPQITTTTTPAAAAASTPSTRTNLVGATPSSTASSSKNANKLISSGNKNSSKQEYSANLYNYDALTTVSANNAYNVPSTHHTFSHKRGVGSSFSVSEYYAQLLLHGKYTIVEVIAQTATVWAASKDNDIDIYSALSERHIATIPGVYNPFESNTFYREGKKNTTNNNNTNVLNGLLTHTMAELHHRESKMISPTSSLSFSMHKGAMRNSHFLSAKSPSKAFAPPSTHAAAATSTHSSRAITAMYASSSSSRMWIGYSDGTVRIMNFVLLEHITQGTFHCSPIVSFAELSNGMMVVGSADGVLSQWTDDSSSSTTVNNNRDKLECIISFLPRDNIHSKNDTNESRAQSNGRPISVTNNYGELQCLCGFRSCQDEVEQSVIDYAMDQYKNGKNKIINLSNKDTYTSITNNSIHYNNNSSNNTKERKLRVGVCGNAGLVFCGFSSGMVCCVDMGLEKIIITFTAHTNRVNAMVTFDRYLFTAAEDHTVMVWRTDTLWRFAHNNHVTEKEQSCKVNFTRQNVLKSIHVQPCVRALTIEECTRSLWVAYANGLIERWCASEFDDFALEESIRANDVISIDFNDIDDVDDYDENDDNRIENKEANYSSKQSNKIERKSKKREHSWHNGLLKLTTLGVARTLQILALSSSGHNKVWCSHYNSLTSNLEYAAQQIHEAITRETEMIASWRTKTAQLTCKERQRQTKYVEILSSLNQKRLMWVFYEYWRRHVIGSSLSREKKHVVDRMALAHTHNLRLRFFSAWLTLLYQRKWNAQRVQIAHTLEHLTNQRMLHQIMQRWQNILNKKRLVCKQKECVNVLATAAQIRLCVPYYTHWRRFAELKKQRLEQRQLKNTVKGNLSEEEEELQEHAYNEYKLQIEHANVLSFCGDHINDSNFKSPISSYHLALLEGKAQRQIMQRVLHTWMQNSKLTKNSGKEFQSRRNQEEEQQEEEQEQEQDQDQEQKKISYPYRFATLCSKWNERRHARGAFNQWHQWTRKHKKLGSLAVVMAMRGQQVFYQLQQLYYLKWVQFVHARTLARRTSAIHAIEIEINEMQSAHNDIFDKLQLQKKLTEMEQVRARDEETLAYVQRRVEQLERTYALLQAKTHTESDETNRGSGGDNITTTTNRSKDENNKENVYSTRTSTPTATELARLSTGSDDVMNSSNNNNNNNYTINPNNGVNNKASASKWTMKGEMSTHDSWYRELVEHQHLSPLVLQHLSFAEALQHVIAQLKGNVLNMYTDMQLFRSVKDKRNAGISAVAIFNEAFAQIKRIAVAPLESSAIVRNNNTGSNSAALTHITSSSRSARHSVDANFTQPLSSYRWPLSFVALDNLPSHHCTSLLNAIKTLLVSFDLLALDEVQGLSATCEEMIGNADWLLLCARAAYMRRRPILPANNRVVQSSV